MPSLVGVAGDAAMSVMAASNDVRGGGIPTPESKFAGGPSLDWKERQEAKLAPYLESMRAAETNGVTS